MLNSCCRPLEVIDGIEPTLLFALNKDVNAINQRKLDELPGELCSYYAEDRVEVAETVPQSEHNRLKILLFFFNFYNIK